MKTKIRQQFQALWQQLQPRIPAGTRRDRQAAEAGAWALFCHLQKARKRKRQIES